MHKEEDSTNNAENFFTDLEDGPAPVKQSYKKFWFVLVVILSVTISFGIAAKLLIVKVSGVVGLDNFTEELVKDGLFGFGGKNKNNNTLDNMEIGKEKLTNEQIALVPSFGLEIYANISDPAIQLDIDSITAESQAFAAKYTDTEWDGQTLKQAIDDKNHLSGILGKLSTYFYLKRSKDRADQDAAKFGSKVDDLSSRVDAETTFFDVKLSKFTTEQIEQFIQEEPALLDYKYKLDYISKQQKHMLSVEVEKYSARKNLVASEAWVKIYDLILSNAKVDVDNMEGKHNIAALINMMSNKNRDIREKSAAAMARFLNTNSNIVANIYNAIVKNTLIEQEERKYTSSIGMRNSRNDISDNVVNNLLKSVRDSYVSTSHRYYKIKAGLLSLEKMKFYDRSVPLDFVKRKVYSFDEAKTMVLNAYASFSPKMQDIASNFFTEGRIHAKALPNKDNGAYCISSGPSVKPYIMMNYLGTMRDVFTLAHELGHGIHGVLSSGQTEMNYSTPITMSEIASIFGERLLLENIMLTTTNVLEKAQLLSGRIEDALDVVVRQVAFANFEIKVHAKSAQQDLSVTDISNIWLETQQESLGGAFDVGSEYANFWSYITHFFHAPFYVYSYAFAELSVDQLYSVYKNETVPDFETKYIDLLSKGGSVGYKELLQPFGLDPESPEFWSKSMGAIEGLISEFEVLVNSEEFKTAMREKEEQ